MRRLEELVARGKRVIVRVDWNVTLGKALQVIDDTRIKRTLPTITWLLEQGASQVVLLAHLGKWGENKSLAQVARYAAGLLGEEIALFASIGECSEGTKTRVKMLENLRRWEGEDTNDPQFVRELAGLGEVYVNEAFGECHRESASIVGLAWAMPAFAGLNLAAEIEVLGKVRDNPRRPLVVVMGGAKVEDKLALLEAMSRRAEALLLGGKLANELVKQGVRLGGGARVIVPKEGADILDIGEETRRIFAREIGGAATVVWNGPMGMVEREEYREGTRAIYEAITANEAAYTIVGGGDTLAAIREERQLERIDFVSTGGGAMLKFLERGTLVGIEALK